MISIKNKIIGKIDILLKHLQAGGKHFFIIIFYQLSILCGATADMLKLLIDAPWPNGSTISNWDIYLGDKSVL